MVRVLAAQGVKVVATARRGDRLQALADEVERQGAARPQVIVADVTEPEALARLAAQALCQVGTVDILINAVGAFHPTTLNDSDRSWDDAFALNFTPARRLTQALLPAMQAQGWGRIINISGSMEPRSLSAASAAKGALHLWAKGLAGDVAAQGLPSIRYSRGASTVNRSASAYTLAMKHARRLLRNISRSATSANRKTWPIWRRFFAPRSRDISPAR